MSLDINLDRKRSPSPLSEDEDALRKRLNSGRIVKYESDGDEEVEKFRTWKSLGLLSSCRSVECYKRLNRIDEGTYGVVFRAKDIETGEHHALKKLKLERETEGFPLTALREINILLSLRHPSIVNVKEVCVGSDMNMIFMVMEFVDHDFKALMEHMKNPFSPAEVKCLLKQLLEGMEYLHKNWIVHRDMKTSNLLYSNKGYLKICDFGLARHFGSPLREYTQEVVTLWYRAPELLLGARKYSTAIDMWSVGCIFAEFLQKKPLFTGQGELDQLKQIFYTLGTPSEEDWPDLPSMPHASKVNLKNPGRNRLREKFRPTAAFGGVSMLTDNGVDLLNRMLTYDPAKRITASEALKHPYFTREGPDPKPLREMPKFQSTNDGSAKPKRDTPDVHSLERHMLEQTKQKNAGPASSAGLYSSNVMNRR